MNQVKEHKIFFSGVTPSHCEWVDRLVLTVEY